MNGFRKIFIRDHLLTGLFLLLHVYASSQTSKVSGYEVLSYKHCELSISGFTGNTVSLAYQTLPANQAGLNHNSLWFWRSSEVPWKYPPATKQLLPAHATQSGSYVLDGVSINIDVEYIACYSVDSTVEQICACAVLPASGDSAKEVWTTIELIEVGANSLTFRYTNFPGYLPATYQNWFGIWKGKASPYNSSSPLATGKPTDDSESNTAGLNGIILERGQVYTLIYFSGKNLTHASAMITFKIR